MKSSISIIVLFFCFAIVHSLFESTHEAFQVDNSRITTGSTASQGFFPYVAEIKANNAIVCAGVIISETWLLTSARCMNENSQYQLTVRVGGVDRTNPSEPGSYEELINRVVIRNDFDQYKNNIALVHVQTPLEFSDVIQAVQLTGQTSPIDMSVPAIVVGWGGDPNHSILKYNADFQLIDPSLCNYFEITPNSICTNSTSPNPSACDADRGGPLLQFDIANNGIVMYGIVSSGTVCNSIQHSFYENIINHRVWIFLVSGV